MALSRYLKQIFFFILCLAPLLLAFLWIKEWYYSLALLSGFLLLLSLLNFWFSSYPLGVLFLFTAIGGSALFFHPHSLPPGSLFRVHNIQVSPSQIRLTLVDLDTNQKILGIYYKPKIRKTHPNAGFYAGVGHVMNCRETKTQLKLTLQIHSTFLELTFPKKYLSPSKERELLQSTHRLLQFQMPFHRFLHLSKAKKKRKRFSERPLYKGSPATFSFPPSTSVQKLDFRDLSRFPSDSIHAGDIVSPIVKTSWKRIFPFTRPFYLFSQGFSFQGTLEWMEISSLPTRPTFSEKIVTRLLALYHHSPYQSFYRSVLLARNPIDKKIYRLFQRNELVHLLVISGAHIEIIISFLIFLLTSVFVLLFGIRHPRKIGLYFRELRFFKIKTRSLPIFLALSIFLILYLNITDSPQAGTRAIFAFLITGFFFHCGWKTSVFVPFTCSILLCFLIYPQWLTYPLGIFYSSLAVFSLYFCLPLITHMLENLKNRTLYFLSFSVLVSSFVSVFIAPLSFYFFHYYNFLSIFTNIFMGILFTIFIYLASFASIMSFISLPLAQFTLHLSDFSISGMLYFLKWTDHISFLKFYVNSFSAVTLVCFYLGLWLILKDLKNLWKIPETTT